MEELCKTFKAYDIGLAAETKATQQQFDRYLENNKKPVARLILDRQYSGPSAMKNLRSEFMDLEEQQRKSKKKNKTSLCESFARRMINDLSKEQRGESLQRFELDYEVVDVLAATRLIEHRRADARLTEEDRKSTRDVELQKKKQLREYLDSVVNKGAGRRRSLPASDRFGRMHRSN